MLNTKSLKDQIIQMLDFDNLESINQLVQLNFTGQSLNEDLVRTLVSALPDIKKPKISILQIATKSTTIIQKLINKYQDQCHILEINLLFDSIEELEICKLIGDRYFPANGMFCVHYLTQPFLEFETHTQFDLIVGIPNNQKVFGQQKKDLCSQFSDPLANNLMSFIINRVMDNTHHLALIVPKYFLHNSEYSTIRNRLASIEINTIIDYGENGFNGSLIETCCLIGNTKAIPSHTRVISLVAKKRLTQKQSDITDPMFPNWILYTNEFFRSVSNKLELDQFKAYRDRSISSRLTLSEGDIRVLNAKNTPRDSRNITFTDNDEFVMEQDVVLTEAYKFLNSENTYLCPNLTPHPRLFLKPPGTVASGSLAILTPKKGSPLTQDQIEYFSSDEFKEFYRIARNLCTRSLNIDKNAVFYFGILKN